MDHEPLEWILYILGDSNTAMRKFKSVRVKSLDFKSRSWSSIILSYVYSYRVSWEGNFSSVLLRKIPHERPQETSYSSHRMLRSWIEEMGCENHELARAKGTLFSTIKNHNDACCCSKTFISQDQYRLMEGGPIPSYYQPIWIGGFVREFHGILSQFVGQWNYTEWAWLLQKLGDQT